MNTHQEINVLITLANNSFDPATIIEEVTTKVKVIASSLSEDSYQIATPDFTFDRWPHQTWEQCLLGEIFFPDDLRHNRDFQNMLYESPKVRILLVISCKYDNPLALYHLQQACGIFYCKNKKIDNIAKKISAILTKRYMPFMELGIKEGNPYIKAISAWYLSSPLSRNLVETALNKKDYRLLSFSREKRTKEYYINVLEEGYYDFPGALHSVTQGLSVEEGIKLCLQYASRGMSEGYYIAYLRGDQNKEYLLKVLEGKNVGAFKEALSIFSLEELDKIAEKLDNEYAYFELAIHREDLDCDCKNYFTKSGMRGYLYKGVDNEKNIIKELKTLLATI